VTIRTVLFTATILALSAGSSPAQTARTGTMMREKLGHAQKILEALTTSNRDLLAAESGALVTIAKSPRWAELRTRELGIYTDNFLKAVAELDAAAKRNDFDTAATQYTAMTTACYQCHRRLKDLRIAR
jgi:cytochrome c556